MIYLITNVYVNNYNKVFELTDKQLDKIQIKCNFDSIYKLGDFVNVNIVNKKNSIDSKIMRPDDFLCYYKKSKNSKFEIELQINEYVSKIEDNDLKLIVEELLLDVNFYIFPAAKTIHHAYIGGLSEHVLSMLKLSDGFILNYNLNQSLLYAGIILHDYGKIIELEHYGLTYSNKGNLIGHILIGYEFIIQVINKYNIVETENIMLLKHMLLSHHGKLEYGSPKLPMTIESYVLSEIDEIDAKINLLESVFKNTNPGEVTPPINGYDRRRFYKMNGESE